MSRIKAIDLYRWGYATPNSPLSFLTNVIQCRHRNPARKMRGLYNLVNSGHQVQVAQFDIDAITIDGVRHPYSELENNA